jgi:hypothetical protein
MRITIIDHGEFTEPAEGQIQDMLDSGVQSIWMPNDDDHDITHWWLLLKDGVKNAYVGTPESFEVWKVENGISVLN